MSAEEFWHGEFRLAEGYREAEEIRRENRYVAEWRQGVYMMHALLTASPAFRELSVGIDHDYPSKPLFGRRSEKGMSEEERQKAAMERNIAVFKAMAEKVNEALAERREKNNGEDD